MKKTSRWISTAALLVASALNFYPTNPVHAAAEPLSMLDNTTFDNANSMTEAQIQRYLSTPDNKNFTLDRLCLANYQTSDANWDGSRWNYNGTVSAAALIYKVSQFWGINPRVILATLQKEQALPHGSDCSQVRFNSAMGYACPSNQTYSYPELGVVATCVNKAQYVGFTRQVLWGAFQLKFARERSDGDANINWQGNGTISYVGPEAPGSRARVGNACNAMGANCKSDLVASYDGQMNLCNTSGTGCKSWTLSNGATASLIAYTPFYPQMFNFWFNQTSSFADGNPNTGTVFIYRLANFITKERLFTAGSGERDSINGRGGWVYEGVAFSAPTDTTLPVYRLANFITKERLFTTSTVERDINNGKNGWVYEGIAFNAATTGGSQVYRLANFITKERLFTTSVVERDTINGKGGWVYEGVAFNQF